MSTATVDGPIVCQFDQTQHESRDALHAYIKRFRVSREKYYKTYYPRFDLLTGEPILFKDVEQYLTADFTGKANLKKWLKERPAAEGLAWSKNWLARRKESKGLVYAPSQVELRTLCCPSMPYYESVAKQEGGYYGVTAALGFVPRYNLAPPVFTPLPANATVIQDTREQTPIKLAIKTTVGTLNVGDYALAAPHDKGIRIERKSLGDFCGTLSSRKVTRKGGRNGDGQTEDSPFARFDRELDRAAAEGLYVVMVVECNLTDAQSFDWLPQTKWIKATPAHVFHNLRELLNKHPLTFQVVFVDGRSQMPAKMTRIFEMGTSVRTTDLQYWLERGTL